MDFIDDQIRQTAAAIMDSKLSDMPAIEYEDVDSILSEELGPDRIGKFFIIRNKNGEALFESKSVRLLKLDVPREPQWVTIHQDKRMIRALNLQLPRSKTRTIQVGVITEWSFFYQSAIDGPAIAFMLSIPALFLIMTWILSSSLFSPLKKVSDYVKDATHAISLNKDVPDLPNELSSQLKEHRGPFGKEDEFKGLLRGISGFATKINANSKFTRQWTHQMVHELKTPLTILNHDLETLTTKHSLPESDIEGMTRSLNQVSRTITNFLDWAELNYQGQRPNLHVVKISSAIRDLNQGLEKVYGPRLHVDIKSDFQILCDPTHLEQLLNNLVTNALKYSDQGVLVEASDYTLRVADKGPGLPAKVLENMGSPFNKGLQTDANGSGLGLAWVKTVSDLYNWKMEIQSSATGTNIVIHFPPIEST